MEEVKKKPYVRPTIVSTMVSLEYPICVGSYFEAQSPHNNGIKAQEVNTDFENAYNFGSSDLETENSGWDIG